MSDSRYDDAPPASLTSWPGTIAGLLAAAITIIGIGWAFDVPRLVGLVVFREQMLAAVLACVFPLILLTTPLRKSQPRSAVPWYDVVLALVGFAAGLYAVIRYPVLALEYYYRPTETFLLGLALVGTLFETLRRSSGVPLTLITAGFILYALFANYVPGHLEGRPQPFNKLIAYLGVDTIALFGLPLYIIATLVIVFVFFGQLLLHSGGSSFFTDLSAALMGRYRGGSAKIAVVASGLFGSISGNSASNVMATGVITIPLMKKGGYAPRDAAAVEAAASTGGQLMPPVMGAAAFLMAEFLQIPYRSVVIAALIPAFLYFLAVFIQADLIAARSGIKGIPKANIPALAGVLKRGWYLVVPFAVLIYALFGMNRRPETAALYACGAVLVLGLLFTYENRRMSLVDLWSAIKETGRLSASVIVIGGMAGLIIGVIQVTGVGFGLTLLLVELGQGSLLLMLVLTAVVCIILGMGMPTTAIYFLLATLVAPPLVQLGVEPMSAHLFVLYFGMMSMLTPPVAFACFVAAAVAGSDPLQTAFRSMMYAWPAYIVPFLFAYSPSLIMIGEPVAIAQAAVTAIFGVWAIAAAIVGVLFTRLNLVQRLLFLVVGGALLTPASLFPGGDAAELAGAVGAAILGGLDYARFRRRPLDDLAVDPNAATTEAPAE